MRILAIADEESPYLWDYFEKSKLEGIDLIISCGDLAPEYLSFLATFTSAPVLYVHGNHDTKYDEHPPSGCISIEDQIYVYQGVRILGLGGSYRYRDGKFMYTEAQMRRRIRRLWFQLRKYGGFDILVTHAPARYINDFDNLSHRGFDCFVDLLEKYKPKYFLHGHIHQTYGVHIPQKTVRGDTTIINAWERYILEL